jgi:hypothetical protein
MNTNTSGFATFARLRKQPSPSEVCEFCGNGLAEEHQHVIQPAARQLGCVCDACAILFSGEGQKYRRIPRGIRFLQDFRLTDPQWESLMIPIGIAFLFRSSAENKVVALYPSPGGLIESTLTLDAWSEIIRDNPGLNTLQPDVEGVLVYRVRPAREYYRIPIDECFRLAGMIRMHWKGLSGGTVVWEQIGQFLARLKERSR